MGAMLPVRPPEPPKRRGVPPTLVLWLGGVVAIIVLDQLWKVLHRFHVSTSAVTFLSFLAWLLVIALTLYGLAIAVRWVLRKLFWTRRPAALPQLHHDRRPAILPLRDPPRRDPVRDRRRGQRRELRGRSARPARAARIADQRLRAAGEEAAHPASRSRSTTPTGRQRQVDPGSGCAGRRLSGMAYAAISRCSSPHGTYPGDRTIVFAEPLDVRWAQRPRRPHRA